MVMRLIFEDFSPSFPDWLKYGLEANSGLRHKLIEKGFDLSRLKILSAVPPISPRDTYLSDPYIPIFRLHSDQIYIKGFNDDDHLIASERNPYTRRPLKSVPYKHLFAEIADFAYIDSRDSENYVPAKSKVRDSIPDPTFIRTNYNKQVHPKVNFYYDDPDVYRYSTDYLKKEYQNPKKADRYADTVLDKSGYEIDPSKYKKLLSKASRENYLSTLQKIHDRIMELKRFYNMYLADLDIDLYTQDAELGTLYSIQDDLKSLVSKYRKIMNNINMDADDPDHLRRYLDRIFDISQSFSSEDTIRELRDAISKLEADMKRYKEIELDF